jgi:hypothetical protein
MAEDKDPGKKGTQEETVPELESDKNDQLGYTREQIDLNTEPDLKEKDKEPRVN